MKDAQFQAIMTTIRKAFHNAHNGTLSDQDFTAVHACLCHVGNLTLASELQSLWQAHKPPPEIQSAKANPNEPIQPGEANPNEPIQLLSRALHLARIGVLSNKEFTLLHSMLLAAGNHALADHFATTWQAGRANQPTFTLSKLHLQRITDPQTARTLFNQSINRIYIEISSYCNRRCPYCPNALIDRISSKQYLPTAILEKIFRELGEIHYNQGLFFNCYNEPLADPDLCDKIALFKQHCPQAVALLFSNGDYLDRDYLQRLHTAGVTCLNISLHSNNAYWDDAAIMDRLQNLAKRLGMTPTIETFSPGSHLLAFFPESPITIKVLQTNFLTEGSNRGGLMQQIQTNRYPDKPCLMPFNNMYIGWDGSILPCCHLHADAPEHQAFKTGNIRDFPDIFTAYSASDLVEWRKATIAPTQRQPPCDTCIERVENEELIDSMRQIHQEMMAAS